jgi:RNA polymerase sigma factor (sigma-70 family)
MLESNINSQPTSQNDNKELVFQMFTEHADFISKVIFTHVRNEEMANDLYQDFFLSLISRPIPPNINNIKSYLYKAISNDIADAKRRMKKYEENIQKYSEKFEFTINNSNPTDALIEEEQKNLMFEFIMQQLPNSSSQAILYRYGDNQSIKEVGKTMGVKSTSVSRYVSTGLDKIKKILSLK